MKRSTVIGSLGLAISLCVASPSLAWIRAGFGFGGARFAFRTAPLWAPYAYPYYPYGSYNEEAPGPYETADAAPAAQSTKIQGILDDVSHQRADIKFRYEDGEISRSDRDLKLEHLAAIEREARSEADSNGGSLTDVQENVLLQELGEEPDQSESQSRGIESAPEETVQSPAELEVRPRQPVRKINDLMLELRTLLDQKLNSGEISPEQRQRELQALSAIAHQVRGIIDAHGMLAADDEDRVIAQLHEAYYNIVHNFLPD